MELCQLCHSQASILLCCCREAGVKVCSLCAAQHFLEDSSPHYPLAYSAGLASCHTCARMQSAYLCTCSLPAKAYCKDCLNEHICRGTAARHDTYPATAKDFIDCKRSYGDYLDRQHLVNSVETFLLGNLAKIRMCRSSVNMLAADLIVWVEKWRKDAQDMLDKEEKHMLLVIQKAFRSLQTIRVKWKFSVENRLEQILSNCVFVKPFSLNYTDFSLFQWELRPEILLIPLSSTLQVTLSSQLLTPVPHLYYVVPWSTKLVSYAVPSIVPIEIPLTKKGKFMSFSAWCALNSAKLCITGGWKQVQGREIYSAEAYIVDLGANAVYPVLDMNTARCRHAMASVKGVIYALGGSNSVAIRSIERLKHETEDWQEVAELSEGKDCTSASVWREKIYILAYFSRKIEVFDPISTRLTAFPIKSESHFPSFLGPKFITLLGVSSEELVILSEQEVLHVDLTSGLSTSFPLSMKLDKSWFTQSSGIYHNQHWFFTTLDQELWMLANNSLEYLARVVA